MKSHLYLLSCGLLLTRSDGFGSIPSFLRIAKVSSVSQCMLSSSKFQYSFHAEPSRHVLQLPRIGICNNDFKISRYSSVLYASIAEDTDMISSSSVEIVEKEKKNYAASINKSPSELAFNFLLLASAFGFALYTILTIDNGMTRGWTAEEIITRIPFDNWRQYEDSLSEKPIFTKTMINVIIYLLGDWLSQTIFQKKDLLDFDASRTLKNGFIGLCFGPIVHQYYEFSDAILPPAIAVNRLYKILMDQTIYLGVKCSVYIAAVGLLGGESISEVKESIQTRIKPIMFTAWKFWPLVHCVTYGVIPARHRILWVNSVDLIWNAILAGAVSKDQNDEISSEVDVNLKTESIPNNSTTISQIGFEKIEDGNDLIFAQDMDEGSRTKLKSPELENEVMSFEYSPETEQILFKNTSLTTVDGIKVE